jgi:zinc protease
VIVCVGDFDEPALLDLIANHYGSIPPAELPDVTSVMEPEQARERVVRAPKPIATDRLLVGYKAPGQDHADWATLEIVSTLLAGCPSARLYRRLVIDREAASSVDAQLTPFRDPSLLRLAVTAARGHSADEVLGGSAIRRCFASRSPRRAVTRPTRCSA